jgi:hypothetical protein
MRDTGAAILLIHHFERSGFMRLKVSVVMGCVAVALVFSQVALAGKNPADFPLRVHIYTHNSHSHYWNGGLSRVDGEGRANLYENSVPTAFEFSYECDTRLMNSLGYETYMARWKKPGSELEILVPATRTACVIRTTMMVGVAYRMHDGNVEQEPSAQFAQWMQKHHYDPEHGLDIPAGTSTAAGDPNAAQ